MNDEVCDPFNPPGVDWHRVEPQLATVRLIGIAITAVVVLIGGVLMCVFWRGIWSILITAVVACLIAWWAMTTPRRVRAMAYAVRDRDLYQRSGIMFRHLTIVPYVRIQYVDIQVGPIERAFGLSTLTVNTAAQMGAAVVRGITPETAAGLREILTNRNNLTGQATNPVCVPEHNPPQPAPAMGNGPATPGNDPAVLRNECPNPPPPGVSP